MNDLRMKIFRATRALTLSALLLSGALAGVASACPNCKEGLDSKDPRKNNIARGYYYSILFMLGTPPTIMAGFGLAVSRAYKRQAEEQASAGDASVSEPTL